VDPARLLAAAFRRDAPHERAVWMVAAGKAAPAMAAEAVQYFGTALQGGLVIAPTPASACGPSIRTLTASHPEPDVRSERAGRAALDLVDMAAADADVIVLLSGGASSLMAVPASGLLLEEKSLATRVLLHAGADIVALNTVRKHLSRIKGGWLAARTKARCRTFIISDVIGDDMTVIASGPTVADPSTYADALRVLDAHGGRRAYPDAVVRVLDEGDRGERDDTPKPGDARLRRSEAVVIGGRREAMRGAEQMARSLGYRVIVQESAVIGEARVAAEDYFARMSRDVASADRPLCVISSGETTVKVTGQGRGGRNQEFALAAVPLVAGRTGMALASVGTDGIDGPTDAAGAIVESTTLDRARAAGLGDPTHYLSLNDAYHFFDPIGDLVRTGPTGTNVGDLQVLLIT
jgi:hydroxypyruvate reductase